MEGVVLTAKSLKNYLRRKNRPSAVPPIQNGKFLKKNYFFIFYWARASLAIFFQFSRRIAGYSDRGHTGYQPDFGLNGVSSGTFCIIGGC